MFSESSSCLLGQHGNCSSAQQPVELSEKNLNNCFNKLPPQTVLTETNNENTSRVNTIKNSRSAVYKKNTLWLHSVKCPCSNFHWVKLKIDCSKISHKTFKVESFEINFEKLKSLDVNCWVQQRQTVTFPSHQTATSRQQLQMHIMYAR